MDDEAMEAIARALSTCWNRITATGFAAELQSVYGRPASLGAPEFESLYIGQATTACIEKAMIGSGIDRWWKMSNSGFESIDIPDFPPDDYDQPMFPSPEFTFYTDGQDIVVGELFSLPMFCRKTGTLSKSDEWVDQLRIGYLGHGWPYKNDT